MLVRIAKIKVCNLSKFFFIKMEEECPYLEYSYYTDDGMCDIINEYKRLEIGGYRLYILNDCYSIRCPNGWKADITNIIELSLMRMMN